MIFLLQVAHRFRKLWWRKIKPQTLGVKVLVWNSRNELLLVKPSYADTWQIPGGGVKRFEHPAAAAVREIREETSVVLDESKLELQDIFISTHEGKSDCVILYAVKDVLQIPVADGAEIEETSFFAPDALPINVAPSVVRRLSEPEPSQVW